jgi:hypothetical protein
VFSRIIVLSRAVSFFSTSIGLTSVDREVVPWANSILALVGVVMKQNLPSIEEREEGIIWFDVAVHVRIRGWNRGWKW